MLTCTSCGTENPPGHRFCGGCGAGLAAVCPACGAPAVAGFRFCGACGSPMDAAGAAPAPTAVPTATTERRVCSVLFADLVGFTPLSEARDPEEVRELLSRYFDTARTVITRYGGLVEKFIGDAVMAVWGTPVAAEGDAERAVRAALDLVAAVAALGGEIGADELALRAGVVTGEVAASLNAVGEGMVAGDAVNTAARVQSAAAPGTVWVDSPTQRLAGASVGFHAAGSHALKGKAQPVELWEATRVLSSVGGTQRVDGLEAPMVGRNAEERTLRELFHASVDRRTPRLVTVTGAAGSGKSRLGWEFEKYVDGLADVVRWHRGRCLSYGEGVAYWALAEAVRQRFGIATEDAVEVARQKFLDGLVEWLPVDEERSFVGVRLGRLLGIAHPGDTGSPLTPDELFAGWRLFLERMADTSPVLLLIEDAQHADDTLLDFVEHVVEWSRQSPIYLVLLARSELIERRPTLAGGRNRTALDLEPLDERSMRELVAALVHDVPEKAVTTIVGQAQGNPLFAVETIRSLIDRDVIVPVDGEYRIAGAAVDDLVGELAVPDSLHALLAARLDVLEPSLRSLVADAAVLGTSFPAEALVAVSGRPAGEVMTALVELVRRDVLDVSTDPLSPERGQYVFGQNMLRQVAYDTLSRRDRRARHLAVAAHLRRAFADDGEEVMEVVAQHYLDALDAVTDTDDAEVRELALDCLVRAAERSERSGARLRAARSLSRAATIVASDDLLRAAKLWERSLRHYQLTYEFDESVAVAQRAMQTYETAGDVRAAARVRVTYATVLRRRGSLDEARDALDSALATLRVERDLDTAQALMEYGKILNAIGDPDAWQVIDEAIGLAEDLDAPVRLMADVLLSYALCLTRLNRHTQAMAYLQHSIELSARAGDRALQSLALSNLSSIALASDWSAATEAGRQGAELARVSGHRLAEDVSVFNQCVALVFLGEWGTALREAEQVVADAGDDRVLCAAISAMIFALRGDYGAARQRSALPELRLSDAREDVIDVAWVEAVFAAAEGRGQEARDALLRVMPAGAEPDLQHEAVGWCWPLALRLAFDAGDDAEVHRLIALLNGEAPGHLPLLLRGGLALARARLAAADGSPDAADVFAAAIRELRAVGSPYHLAQGLLDHAEFLEQSGLDGSGQRAEAAGIGERLGAVEITRRLAEVVVG